jgi:RNA recognition motif-containing protein
VQLPFHVQWQDLKDLFRQAGTIVRADVALGPDGRSRGFGTVVFATEKDARRAVGMFSGYVRFSVLRRPFRRPSSVLFRSFFSYCFQLWG